MMCLLLAWAGKYAHLHSVSSLGLLVGLIEAQQDIRAALLGNGNVCWGGDAGAEDHRHILHSAGQSNALHP